MSNFYFLINGEFHKLVALTAEWFTEIYLNNI
jgi:hypothetical protein